MPNIVVDLAVDRVDLVDEGANSAAFIELFKRKENGTVMDLDQILGKMKPEHAEVIKAELAKNKTSLGDTEAKLTEVTRDLADVTKKFETANAQVELLKGAPCDCEGEADDNGICKACGRRKTEKQKKVPFDETETMKGMPAEAREFISKLRAQKDAAEEELRKAKDAEVTAQAVIKAAEFKSIPVPADKLVSIIKKGDPDMLDILTTVNAAINGTVLNEVGKSTATGGSADAWGKIEAKADEVSKRDSITKQKAIGVVIKENPDLYREYLDNGGN